MRFFRFVYISMYRTEQEKVQPFPSYAGSRRKTAAAYRSVESMQTKEKKDTKCMIGVVFQDSVLDGPLTVKDSFQSSLPEFLSVSDKLINGTVAAQLVAALLAVSCVTVTFCVNLTMIQDKANGARKDFNVSPTGKPVIYLGYLYCLAVCFRASCVIR